MRQVATKAGIACLREAIEYQARQLTVGGAVVLVIALCLALLLE